MRFQMRAKLISLRGAYNVTDDSGRDVFIIRGRFSLAAKLSIEDLAGKEVAVIRQRATLFRPTYDLLQGNQVVATVRQEPGSVRPRYWMDLADGSRIDIEGDLSGHEYEMARDGSTVALVSKKFWSVAGSYGVEVSDGTDPVMALSCAAIIDLSLARRRRMMPSNN